MKPFTVRLVHDRVSSDVLARYVSLGGAVKAAKALSLEWPSYAAIVEGPENVFVSFVNGRKTRKN